MSVKGGKRRASVNFAVSRIANTEKKPELRQTL